MLLPSRTLLAILAASVMASISPSQASERRFAFSYETTTMPKGTLEFEPWVTYKHFDDANVFDFRYELEYGVTDRLQIAAYLSDWSYTDLKHGGNESTWESAGLEAIYSLSNPNTDWIGSALYGEVRVGPEVFALEGKLLLQKNFGKLAVVYNAVLEAEWEGEDYEEQVGVLENTFGLSYELCPALTVGVEATHEVEFEDWSEAGEHVVFVGPNLSYRTKGFYATVAGLFQASDIDDEPNAEVRLLLGFTF